MTVSNEPEYTTIKFTYSKQIIVREIPMPTEEQFDTIMKALAARMEEDTKAAIVASYPRQAETPATMASKLWEQNWYAKMRRYADGPRRYDLGYGYFAPVC